MKYLLQWNRKSVTLLWCSKAHSPAISVGILLPWRCQVTQLPMPLQAYWCNFSFLALGGQCFRDIGESGQLFWLNTAQLGRTNAFWETESDYWISCPMILLLWPLWPYFLSLAPKPLSLSYTDLCCSWCDQTGPCLGTFTVTSSSACNCLHMAHSLTFSNP